MTEAEREELIRSLQRGYADLLRERLVDEPITLDEIEQRVEEIAAKTAVKLLFPLLMFIFPSIWVVVVGPAIIMIAENLKF